MKKLFIVTIFGVLLAALRADDFAYANDRSDTIILSTYMPDGTPTLAGAYLSPGSSGTFNFSGALTASASYQTSLDGYAGTTIQTFTASSTFISSLHYFDDRLEITDTTGTYDFGGPPPDTYDAVAENRAFQLWASFALGAMFGSMLLSPLRK